MPPSRRKLAEELVIEAKKREISGLITYGDFDPATDQRILTHEALDEVLDCWNYIAVFLHKKYPSLHRKSENVRALILSLYISLRHLEEYELDLTDRTRARR